MKANKSQMPEQLKTTIQSLATVAFFFILLFLHNAILIAFAGAALFSITFALRPDSFRSRSSSLKPALFLLGLLWLCAAVTAVLLLFGKK